jgi:hypothetical protein
MDPGVGIHKLPFGDDALQFEGLFFVEFGREGVMRPHGRYRQ